MTAAVSTFGFPDGGPTRATALRPSRFTSPDHVRVHHCVTLEAGQEFKDVFEEGFFRLAAHKIHLSDLIEVRDDLLSFWGLVIVTACDQVRSFVRVQPLQHVRLAPESVDETIGAAFKIENRGLTERFAVVRSSDGTTVRTGIKSHDEAKRVIATELTPHPIGRTN
jgi:hypothetical protein